MVQTKKHSLVVLFLFESEQDTGYKIILLENEDLNIAAI
jgi:hypothetical protein